MSLSDAARRLQGQTGLDAQFGVSDLAAEEQVLGTLTGKSLVAMGIVRADEVSGARITFDTLSYDVSSSTSISLSQQSQQARLNAGDGANLSLSASRRTAQFISDQEATFVGHGHIVTADGREFEFETELQLSNVTTVEQSEQSLGIDSGGTSRPVAGPPPPDLAGQLLDMLRQSSGMVNGVNAGPLRDAGGATRGGGVMDLKGNNGKQSATAINWQDILSETKGLFDLLDSLATPDQKQRNAVTENMTEPG